MMSITATADSGIKLRKQLSSASLSLAQSIELFRPLTIRYIECYLRYDDAVICFSVVHVKLVAADWPLVTSHDDDNGL